MTARWFALIREGDSSGTFTPSSGVFVSTNSGATWTNRSDPGMLYWTKDLVVDPNDATQKTWLCWRVQRLGRPAEGLGGLYRTTNRGVLWTRINNLDRVTTCAFNPLNLNEAYLTPRRPACGIHQHHFRNAIITQVAGSPSAAGTGVF